VLDQWNQLEPDGVQGELCISGHGLARGYIDQPELTREKFEHITIGDGPHVRLYHTGDLVRWLPDGNLEFLGRIDNQVQLHGHRIELAEIEGCLIQIEQISAAVTDLIIDEENDKQYIAAYVVPEQETQAADRDALTVEIRRELSLTLPGYMVPSVFVWLEEIPLSLNGKVDRTALPEPQTSDFQNVKNTSPNSKTEKLLHSLWCEVLGVQNIGIDENFFLVGGDSLAAMRLLNKINEAFEVDIPLFDIVSSVTIAQQAVLLEQDNSGQPRDCLVALNTVSEGVPIYMIPGLGGHARIFTELSSVLSLKQPVLAFDPLGMDGRAAPHGSVRAAAEYYAQRIVQQQSHGPCILLGYSMGASVAFEVAQILKSSSVEVPTLVVIDGYALYPKLEEHIKSLDPEQNQESVNEILSSAFSEAAKVGGTGLMGIQRVMQSHAQWHYDPGQQKVLKVYVVQSDDCPINLKRQWQQYSSDKITFKKIKASHDDLLHSPNVKKIASLLDQWCLFQSNSSDVTEESSKTLADALKE